MSENPLIPIYKEVNQQSFIKDTEGYGYSYLKLPTILSIINPILNKHESTLVFTIEDLVVTGTITTKCGVSYKSSCPIIIPNDSKNPMQSIGSGITYAKRYIIQNLFNLAIDEDDDGASLSRPSKTVKKSEGKAPVKTDKLFTMPFGDKKGQDIRSFPTNEIQSLINWQEKNLDPSNKYYESNKNRVDAWKEYLIHNEQEEIPF